MKKALKVLIKILVFIVLIIASISALYIQKGYQMYKAAIDNASVENMVKIIQDKPNYTKLSELPKTYINAVISVEDHRFYKHNGIDVIAIGRAFINDIKAMSFAEGGSTITQQLCKNMYFTQDKKIERKIAEVFAAFNLERKYTKDQILELYLNTCYFGDGYYTIKDATMGYFNKKPEEMTDSECIMLAGIPNAPSVYSPNKNPELAKERQKQVINKMLKYKIITQKEANEILKQ